MGTVDALRGFPALAPRRDHLLHLLRRPRVDRRSVATALESDVALLASVLAVANRSTDAPGGVAGVRAALGTLSLTQLEGVVRETEVFDFFEGLGERGAAPHRFALHAAAVQRAAERIGRDLDGDALDELLSAALLHDVGKLVLAPPDPAEPSRDARTPEQRLRDEGRELGTDHAAAGAALARRWGLPERLAAAIEDHHADDARGAAAIVRLADLVTHYWHGDPVDPDVLLAAGRRVGLDRDELGSLLYEITYPLGDAAGASPLSGREQEVLRRLARGRTYKQIALDLGISTSTVRGHLHRIYSKLDVVDRAQAVLIAVDLGWI
jgi:putative nucleotidyltransferase with HDIG domain